MNTAANLKHWTPPPTKPDPTYLVTCHWTVPGQQAAGFMMVDQYQPKIHGRPSEFSPAHTQHIVQVVRETLAQQGLLGAQVALTLIYRYTEVPSALIDVRGDTRD